jgi:hypothetical protein
MDVKYDFNDILIKPATLSEIESRKNDINPFYNGFLPLITAPMDTVIDKKNIELFNILGVITCTPRGETNTIGFESYSLGEIEDLYFNKQLKNNGKYLIDIANGHMEALVIVTRMIKEKYPTLTLMVGNVANPMTYVELSNAGADYVRVGIGNGGGCSTTVHTGVGFPMASLISECYK